MENGTVKTLWISKYALTDGVLQREWDGKVSEHGYVHPKGMWQSVKLGKDAHQTEAEAKVAAEQLRKRKIAGLKRQVERLEAMHFDA